MNLDELQSPMTSVQLAKMLKKQHGIAIPVGRLSQQQAQSMLESVQTKINRFRNTSAAHVSEQNGQYTAMLMVEQVLRTRIDEYGDETSVWGATKRIARTFADKGREAARGAGINIPYSDATKIGSIAGEIGSQARQAGAAYLKYKGADVDPTQPSARTTQSIDSNDVLNALAKAGRMNPSEVKNLATQKQLTPDQVSALQLALQNIMRGKISESHYIAESAMGEAEVILAAKDLADRIQDMVETIGKMVNEELPALTETVRDTMDAERADAFNASALETLNGALEAVRGTKDSLDAAARTLAGEEAAEPADTLGAEEPAAETEPAGDETETEPAADLMNTPGTATGGKSEPLGRGKR